MFSDTGNMLRSKPTSRHLCANVKVASQLTAVCPNPSVTSSDKKYPAYFSINDLMECLLHKKHCYRRSTVEIPIYITC